MSIFNHVSALGWTKYKAAGKPLVKGWMNAIVDFLGQKFTTETNLSVDTISESTSGSGVTIDGVLIKDGAVTVTAAEIESMTTGITAFATGGQAGATALTTENNNITVCATAGDSVVLPAAVAGTQVFIKNSGAAALDIFPASADKIDALAINLAVRIQPGSTAELMAIDGTTWESNLDGITLNSPTTVLGQLEIKAANSAGNTVTLITNASQAGARTYTIPDAGASASFVMNQGATTIYAGAATTPLTIDGGTTDHTGTAPLLILNLDIAGAACNMIYGTIDVTTTALTADAVYGCYFDINGLAADNDTSSLNGYAVQLTATSTSRADNVGFVVGIDGTRDTADTDNGFISGWLNYNLASANAYGFRMSGISGTGVHTSGNFYGYHALMANAVTAGASIAYQATLDTAEISNAHHGLVISKNLVNSTAVGALAMTGEALSITSTNRSSAAASGASTIGNILVEINEYDRASVVTADVFSGNVVSLTYAAETDGTGTATLSRQGVLIDYDLTESAGVLTCSAFDVVEINFDSNGTPVFGAGTYNILNVIGSTSALSPAYAASCVFNGIYSDLSAMVVTDADLMLSGVNVLLPAIGTSLMRGVYAASGAVSATLVDGTNAITYAGTVCSTATIGDGLSAAYNAVKTLYYTVGVETVAATVDYAFDDDVADQVEQVIRLGGAFDIIPASCRIIDVVVRCTENLSSGAATATLDVGITSGGGELIAAAAVDDINEIIGMTAGAGPLAAALGAAAQSVYFSVTPNTNWNDASMTTGKWAIWITYVDAGAVL